MKSINMFKGGAWLAAGAGVCLLLAGNASADTVGLTVSLQSVNASPGDVGDTFEVDVENTGGAAVTVAGFEFGLSISDTDITLEDATVATTLFPYIFASDSVLGPDILVSTDGQSLQAEDVADDAGVTLSVGETLGLGVVSFDVAADATLGVVPVTLSSDTADTNFSDPIGNAIPILGLNNGGIAIVTPEPSSWLLIAGGLVLLGLGRVKVRRVVQGFRLSPRRF